MGTFGSLTRRFFRPAVRPAARQARLVLMQFAPESLGVAKDRLVVDNGVVSVKGGPSKEVTYGAGGVHAVAADAVAAGRGRYGMILWVKNKDYVRAARALRAR